GALRNFLLIEAAKPQLALMQVIENKRQSFTIKEAKIAEFIKINAIKVPQLTISEMAKQLEISEPTITRFCKKIEVNSFQELKMQLQGSQIVKEQYQVVNKNTGLIKERYINLVGHLDTQPIQKQMQLFANNVKEIKHLYIFSSLINQQIIQKFQKQQAKLGIKVDFSANNVDVIIPLLTKDTPLLIIEERINTVLLKQYNSLIITIEDNDNDFKLNGRNYFEQEIEIVYLLNVLTSCLT
ncbi:MAG: MurR/RpiR family transcriptional regulator, partial [Bacilli bacterium]